nr:alpha/beta hydrolase [Actinomycetota bacterium]
MFDQVERRRTQPASLLIALSILLTTSCADTSQEPSRAGAPSVTPTVSSSQEGGIGEQKVDVGGRSLFVQCRGTEGPVVVLEAGLTGDHATWDSVIDGLPPEVRVCAYDRANIGQSDPAETPRRASEVVADLRAVLTAIEEEPPYVLVGFSIGGLFTQLYAAEHPEEVQALILVESVHPNEDREFEKHLTREQRTTDRTEIEANPEGIDVFGSFAEAREAGEIPEIPLVVVTATLSSGWPPGWDAALFDRLKAKLQQQLTNLSPEGRQVLASGSGH